MTPEHPLAEPGLERQARTFTTYLVGQEADPYVIAAYIRLVPATFAGGHADIDDRLVRFATAGPRRARIADAYARWFRPHGSLRRRLVLMTAILESSGSAHRHFTSGCNGSVSALPIRLVLHLLAFGAALALGVLYFGPRQLLAGRAPGARQG